MRVLVVGCGGLGGIVTATLLASGLPFDVCALTTNREIARTVNERGFVLRGVDGARTVSGRIETELSEAAASGPFDVVVLATQPPDVEAAARRALPALAERGVMVCLQNGLCEERVARIAGADRVVGAVVAWGGAMPEPGLYERTSAGGFTIGRFDGALDDPRLAEVAMLFEPIGPVATTGNLAGARWSKLAINCAISTLGTIGGSRLGPLMLHRFVRRLALEIMSEAVRVARAEKVKLEKVAGTLDLEWIALGPEGDRAASASLIAKHSMLLAVGARYRRMRSSMLAAIERGREPAVDYLNGEVVTRARRHGIAAPFNAAACELVHAIAKGKARPGMDTLEAFGRELEV